MTSLLSRTALLAALLAGAGTLTVGMAAAGSQGHRKGMDVDKMFARMDTNQDGFISKEEMTAAHAEMAERRAGWREKRDDRRDAMREKAEARMNERFDTLDTNDDGVLVEAEALAAASARFAAQDLNGDGQVTPEEIKAAHEARKAERRGE